MNTAPLLSQPRSIDSGTRATGWVFLAVDGYTGPAWDGLTANVTRVASALVEAHLTAASPVDEAHRVCGTVPEVPVVCRTRAGEAFMVPTSATGHVEVYTCTERGGEPQMRREFVDGEATAALYGRLVNLLGAPTREDSNASA